MDVRLTEIIHKTATELQSEAIELEVMPNHVHVLCEVDPQFDIYCLVKRLNGRSSRLLRQEFAWLNSRLPTLWTQSYPSTWLRPGFVATVALAMINQYIEQQKER